MAMKDFRTAFRPSQERYTRRIPLSSWMWLAGLFGLFGLLAMLVIAPMVLRHGFLTILGIVATPFVLMVLVLALRAGLPLLAAP